ncbi:hypothetical protein BA190_09995 [Labrys sp. WJW]|uniref:hypothetical protein n=1 Tax=Labrys sp. WJW TaxID=1737983 RepID=UPI000833CC79|nr:hypothetical protein [Labrys sp. WJW]OCC05225.1 hypothetical protein BA190_09995 [Labrys sp. WJW]
MKVITVWQPWATLIALGFKPYEFRGWAAPRSLQGERIGIHAGKRPVRRPEIADLIQRLRSDQAWTTCLKPEALPVLERALTSPGILPLSHVVCTAVLGKPIRAWQIVGEFGGAINDSDRDEHCNFAWPLTDVAELQPPQPATGAQGFWDWKGGENG